MMFNQLAAPFPPEAISWRAQQVTKNGDKALALAYIDARDLMRRLDEVCGPENWQDAYTETARGRVICTLSIRINGEWVSKSDGAGDTDVEGEKGGMSDAFKRAGVKWGVGRYLYETDTVFAPCETYERNGKAQWKAWKPEAARMFAAALAKAAGVKFTAGNAAKDTPPPPAITANQLDELQQLFDHLNVPVAEFLTVGKLHSLKDLPADRFDRAKAWINKRALEQREQKEAA